MEKEEIKEMTKGQVLVMAIAAGVSVANIYYNQPILKYIAESFHVSESSAGSISMLSQIGYGIGLFFLIPLGDKVSRRKMILVLMLLLCLSLVGIALAPTLSLVAVLSVIIGILSVTPQVIIPLAAAINHRTRGKTVGTIFSGLLIGILAARVISGIVADWLGWRSVFALSALLCLLLWFLLKFNIPDLKSDFKGNYGELLKSTLHQFTRFAELREAALMGALMFGVFCSFWTTLTFHLSAPPFQYSAKVIGLFGLVAISGALMAPFIGKLTDIGKKRQALQLTVLLTIISVLLIKMMPHSLIGFIIAIILLDVGVQGAQVANAARIYALDETSGSRINTVYMTSYFIGGALGTAIGLLCWKWGGWSMVTSQMLLWSVLAFIVVGLGGIREKKSKVQFIK